MTAAESPRPKSLTTRPSPRPADHTAPRATLSGEKSDAEGVLSALPARQQPPQPSRPDGRHPLAWLHITAPRGATPTATSRCACGRDRSAVGHRRVLALIEDHTTHRTVCPLRTNTEGRNAA